MHAHFSHADIRKLAAWTPLTSDFTDENIVKEHIGRIVDRLNAEGLRVSNLSDGMGNYSAFGVFVPRQAHLRTNQDYHDSEEIVILQLSHLAPVGAIGRGVIKWGMRDGSEWVSPPVLQPDDVADPQGADGPIESCVVAAVRETSTYHLLTRAEVHQPLPPGV